MFQYAKEGWPFIIFFSALTAISAFLGSAWVTALSLMLTLFMFYFFRDPDRTTARNMNAFIAPADGKIIYISGTREDEALNDAAMKISIFMSPLNVHVNRAPCDGTVKSVQHYPGRFHQAYKDEASILNEHITMLLDTERHGRIVVKQIAGTVARRAVCRVKPGDRVVQGQRFGIIKFSSRVDIFLPPDAEVRVKLNDRVTAGETVLAVMNR